MQSFADLRTAVRRFSSDLRLAVKLVWEDDPDKAAMTLSNLLFLVQVGSISLSRRKLRKLGASKVEERIFVGMSMGTAIVYLKLNELTREVRKLQRQPGNLSARSAHIDRLETLVGSLLYGPEECEHKWRYTMGLGVTCRDCGTPAPPDIAESVRNASRESS